MTRPLEEAERRLAETAAHVIAKAEEIKLPDTPDRLVPPRVLRLLAIAHIELLEQVRAIHDHVDQIARVAIEGALREVARQQGGIATGQIIDEARSEGMLTIQPFVAALPRRPSSPPSAPSAPSGPQLVVPCAECKGKGRIPTACGTPEQGHGERCPTCKGTGRDPLPSEQLLKIYCRVMNEYEDAFVKHETYIVRVWDGMDGCWTNCTGEVSCEEALRYWAKETDGGTRRVAYAEIDYYKIFPGGTRMAWDGSEGREMFR